MRLWEGKRKAMQGKSKKMAISKNVQPIFVSNHIVNSLDGSNVRPDVNDGTIFVVLEFRCVVPSSSPPIAATNAHLQPAAAHDQ